MDLNSVGILLQKIMINYPTARTGFIDKEGRISRAAAEEWKRQLGFLEYDEALKRLDTWMQKSDKAPRAVDLMSTIPAKKTEYVSGGIGAYMLTPDGTLTNEDGMIFAYPDLEDVKFYYNARGDIAYRDRFGKEVVKIRCEDVNERRRKAEEMRKEAGRQDAGGESAREEE